MNLRIAICAAQVPFVRGGAEVLYGSLRDELVRRGHAVEIVALPFNWSSRLAILKSALAWRLLDLTTAAGENVDLVIATRFPSYAVRHPRKVVWLVHQFRQIYELAGTHFSDFGTYPEDGEVAAMLRALDARALGEANARYAISRNTADRLRVHNDIDAEPLYPPPQLGHRYRSGPAGDYVFTVGRLDPMKRFDLLVRALAQTRRPLRAVIAGEGPEAARLRSLAAELGVGDRLELLGRVDDERLIELYAGALGVFYAPFDEDYGYVTVEAFRSGRPIVTCADAGGVLEFVRDGENGFVCAAGATREIAHRLDELYDDRAGALRLGRAGAERVAGIGWDAVVERLLAGL
ncbi:MAG: glycosyltransferase family 4 protein [Thermoanaerobaculia bacterium]|nr:glycosyltransferase family 4 protein [Thermoanaerobaculia bacterium]